MRLLCVFIGHVTKINRFYITRKLAKHFSEFLTAREKNGLQYHRSIFYLFRARHPDSQISSAKYGVPDEESRGLRPPSLSRSCVKNRGVYCKLVLWLMRLSSSCRNRVQAQDLVLANISQRSFTSKILQDAYVGFRLVASGIFSAVLSHESRKLFLRLRVTRLESCLVLNCSWNFRKLRDDREKIAVHYRCYVYRL